VWPMVSGLWKAGAGEPLESRSLRPGWATQRDPISKYIRIYILKSGELRPISLLNCKTPMLWSILLCPHAPPLNKVWPLLFKKCSWNSSNPGWNLTFFLVCFQGSLSQHTLSLANLNKHTHVTTGRREEHQVGVVKFWMECSSSQLGGLSETSGTGCGFIPQRSQNNELMGKNAACGGSLGGQSKLVFWVRMGIAVIESPTGTGLGRVGATIQHFGVQLSNLQGLSQAHTQKQVSFSLPLWTWRMKNQMIFEWPTLGDAPVS
jgi:hypothetical protein